MRATFSRLVAALVLTAAALLGSGGGTRAEDLAAAMAGLADKSFDKRIEAIDRIAATGDERAAAILSTLADGDLYTTPEGRFVVPSPSEKGAFTDALTGETVEGLRKSAVDKVKTNNRMRGLISAAIGTLTLQSPNPQRRLAAARAVFDARDAGAVPALDAAIAKETDDGVKLVMQQARAAAILKSDAPEAEKLQAVEIVARMSGQDALGLLRPLAGAGGELGAAADRAIAAIEKTQALWAGAQNVIYGLSLGSVLLLAAIGLAITFGVMGVINMAHGEMVMLGAYTTFVVQETIRTSMPGLFDWSLLIALPLAFLVAGAVGVALERGVIQWLYGRPLETLLATWGVSLILQQAVRSIFGPNNREVGNPSWMSGNFQLGELTLTWNRLYIIAFTLLVFAALYSVIRFTSFGLQMRAVVQNRRMASSMGIRTRWIDALTFGLGSGIAGIAGVAISQIDNVSPNLGQGYIIDSFMVVVFGGVGNLWGTLVGAMTLGIANKFLEPYAGAVLAKILVLVFIILFIQKRPRGLFALKGRAVEA
ncbi:MAG: urea ABC transporter permease subunit UrtB [Flavobacteriaceae bacterium]